MTHFFPVQDQFCYLLTSHRIPETCFNLFMRFKCSKILEWKLPELFKSQSLKRSMQKCELASTIPINWLNLTMKSVPAIPTWQITFEKGRDKFALESKALETEKKKMEKRES